MYRSKQVFDLYRAPWQIEIALKRLKSLFRYNEMPARKEGNIKTQFYGELLLATLCETPVNNRRLSPSGGRSAKRRKAQSRAYGSLERVTRSNDADSYVAARIVEQHGFVKASTPTV